MDRLRILVLGPDCGPEELSIPFLTYCHAAALAPLHDFALVLRLLVEDSLALPAKRSQTSANRSVGSYT